jgi:hemolysin activation/secretion protein
MNLIKSSLIVVVCNFALSSNSLAESDVNQSVERNLEQIRRGLEKERQVGEIINIKKARSFEVIKKPDAKETKEGRCFTAKSVDIAGNKIFTSQILRDKFLNNLPDCFKKSDLEKTRGNIQNFYIKHGYSNARVYFDEEAAKQNKLLIKIYEGIIKDIKLENNSTLDKYLPFRKKTKLFTAFPFIKNKVFNLKDFEQGLDQMNRLSSNKAIAYIEPGSDTGTSDVVVKNVITKPTRVSVGYDNLGQERTGRLRKSISLSQDNLLALNDNLYINYTKDNVSREEDRYSKSFYSSLSVPLGKWTSSVGYFHSKYLSTYVLTNSVLKSRGSFEMQSYKLDRSIARTKNYKIKLGSELEIRNVASYLNDSQLANQTRKVVPVSIFLDNVFYTKNSTLYLKPSFVKGTKLLNAKKDDPDISSRSAHAQYEMVKIYGYYSYNFAVPKFDTPLNYTISFDAQHSFDSLYPTEQISIGSQYTIRGFNYDIISGDSGYNIRNDLKVKVSNLASQSFSRSKLAGASPNFAKDFNLMSVLNKSYISLFYDYGYVRNKHVVSAGEGTMSGAGAKFIYDGQYFDWEATYAVGLHSPKFTQSVYGEGGNGETIYFNIKLNL